MEHFCKTLVPLNIKIGVLCGGMSSEREVSLRSGKKCYNALRNLGYCNIDLIDVDKNIAKTLVDRQIELAYLALHGKYGEDGCIQGLLEIMGIPYTGCKVSASAISMDKDITKRVLSVNPDIPLIKSQTVKKAEMDGFELELNYPVIIKPVCEGSSIGMTKVEIPEKLNDALDEAFRYNDTVLIEEFLKGDSLTVGVLDNYDETFATNILKLNTKTEWYDYQAKYTEGLTEFELPAQIGDNLTQKIKEIAVKVHKEVGARGVSRVDFLLTQDGTPYVLEINTIPGMTDLSDLPAQAGSMGIEYDQLVKMILNSALL